MAISKCCNRPINVYEISCGDKCNLKVYEKDLPLQALNLARKDKDFFALMHHINEES